jgi:NAD(P)-dependent dehydrogenase (short-subunit alcohol dehydrogenase family)
MYDRRTLLITGCSSGIGLDAARTMATRGWRVFATCRKPEDCARLETEGLESFPLDVADAASVEAGVAEALTRTGGTLNALFNNAAYALPGALEDIPREALREIFEANFFGVHDLTRRVMPAMRLAGWGRIVNCSSILGLAAMRFRGPYNASKFAMEGLTDTLRLELNGSTIKAILIEPGPVATRIRVNARPHFEKWIDVENSAWRREYEEQIKPRLYAPDDGPPDMFELPTSAVSKKLIQALESPRPRARYYVTTPTYIVGGAKRLLSTRLLDAILRRI